MARSNLRRAGPVVASLLVAASVMLSILAVVAGDAQAEPRRHGLSTFGELAYSPDFKHFAWVRPDAPKGGQMSMIGTGGTTTFDSFNPYILRGDPAQGLSLLFDSLMARASDEPDAMYGLIAESAEVAVDRLSVTFHLRAAAAFADGSPVTAADVVATLALLRNKGHPQYRLALRDVVGAEAIDPRTVRFSFKGELVRDLPLLVAGLPVLSRAHYEKHPFEQSSLVPPLGSGPYRIGDFKQGAHLTLLRRDDYWAKDLAVNKGRWNFDKLRWEYFRDRAAELQALKAGAYDLREEFTSRDWATAYQIDAVKEGRLQLLTIPDENPSGTQGFFINTRRGKFRDPRVRKALDHAFDYEWTNKNLFFGLYKRTTSYFENSDMAARGKPSAAELALLEPHRAKLAREVFGEVYVPPVSDGSGADRKLLREAHRLLDSAGFKLVGGKRLDTTGKPFEIEFLMSDPTSERLTSPYARTLERFGIKVTMRTVDAAQYERRSKSHDYDVKVQRFAMRLTPGIELRNYFGSEAARTEGSLNLAGVADPVVDVLIDAVMSAKSRAELVTATRALDRVLRAGHYWVSHWYKAAHNIVHWDKFSRPAVKPRYARGVIDTWWYDAAKAARLR